MNNQQQELQVTEKKRRSKKQQEPAEVIDISAIKGTGQAEHIRELAIAAIHEQKRKQTDIRYAKRVKMSDHKVQEIAENFRLQLESFKPGERPKMWIIVKDMLEVLKIVNRELAVSATEVAQAIKDVFGRIYPDIDSKPLAKQKTSVKSMFFTCIKHGYEIHSVKIDGVERYFLHRNKEDFDAYRERKELRIDNEFVSLDDYIERTDRILKEQNEKENVEVMVGTQGETIIESEQIETEQQQQNESNNNKSEDESE